jgi:hypothetical protein
MRLIGLFVTLGKDPICPDKHDYPTALSTNVKIMEWLSDNDHPARDVLEADVMTENEELGEIAFSVLARGMQGNPTRSDVKQVSKNFILTRERMRIAKDMGVEYGSEDLMGAVNNKEKKSGNLIRDDDVNAAADHFKFVLRQFKGGQWRPLSPNAAKANKNQGLNQLQFNALLDTKLQSTSEKWDAQVTEADMQRVHMRAANSLTNKGKPWVFLPLHGDVWDEFRPAGTEPDSDEPVRLSGTESEQSHSSSEADAEPDSGRNSRKRKTSPEEEVDASDRKAAHRPKSKAKASSKGKKKKRRKRSARAKGSDGSDKELFYPLKIRGDRVMEGTDELQFRIQWKDHPATKEWTWEPGQFYMDEFPKLTDAWFKKRGESTQ